MKNKIIIGNQKNYMNMEDVCNFLNEVKGKINDDSVIICPSNIYVPFYLRKDFSVGIQNIMFDNSKAYTGEVSTNQVKSIGINYTILGHSERRENFDEFDLFINKKIKDALEKNLKVVLCIGETEKEKNSFKTFEVLKKQLTKDLNDIKDLKNIIIAYEPIWAIGTSITPTSEEIEKTIKYIKEIIKNDFGHDDIKVLYGGSVSSKNIEELNKIIEVDGFLIGKSSTNPMEFLKIIELSKS